MYKLYNLNLLTFQYEYVFVKRFGQILGVNMTIRTEGLLFFRNGLYKK